ncbi:hypothetical protein [Hansschlegelia zhihuaiae]|uniref:Uncharacterized protein n=1 Tax=Hansschlegelia zhihuaiae TaxID=405005 RepID=A0A4Q0MHQ7_9HYPH|nr:hypothetical protein [Hansschlegelia zhihuaiae]RXF72935.1 hypothetical protein EK403_12360 [Hansschlegelia zhihuaiae]
MNAVETACAAGLALLASMTAAIAAPASTPSVVPLPDYGGAWVYDGRTPPTCNARDVRVRHFAGDGHPDTHADHAHLGHGHAWSKRNFKGQPTKPPCYVRRAFPQSETPSASATAATRNVLSGDLS